MLHSGLKQQINKLKESVLTVHLVNGTGELAGSHSCLTGRWRALEQQTGSAPARVSKNECDGGIRQAEISSPSSFGEENAVPRYFLELKLFVQQNFCRFKEETTNCWTVSHHNTTDCRLQWKKPNRSLCLWLPKRPNYSWPEESGIILGSCFSVSSSFQFSFSRLFPVACYFVDLASLSCFEKP